MPSIDDIEQNFAFIDDWEERYRYVIELGRDLDPLPTDAHSEANRVKGCASQVWLETAVGHEGDAPILTFRGDSDAHIVKGLIAITLALYSGRAARDILALDAAEVYARLGLTEHLTPQRSNGVRAMVDRIKRDAAQALGAEAAVHH
ncbi:MULTISPECIES: SufE family protein [Lichenihabitans]|uniref:SufE family protein n=1 Tax=Lichenihabitans TaxID=2723776 RepID=UPI001036A8C9|nr:MULTISPECIES: SufE family protein [Lichenihabitans]UDL94859.1 SufE family protein [Lichenihabitans sp. PAMC28606]